MSTNVYGGPSREDEKDSWKAGVRPKTEGRSFTMAAGSSRIARYILLAFFCIAVIYFTTSSTIPANPIPSSWGSKPQDGPSVPNVPGTEPGAPPAQVPAGSSAGGTKGAINGGPPPTAGGQRVNATFVTLARNSDLWEIVKSIRHIEDRFNRDYHYDWVFLNDQDFDEAFKSVTSSLVSGNTHYGRIPEAHWSFPDFIDQERAKKVREEMAQKKIIYGDSVSYRHMCRYESGFFFRHPLMHNYEYYWRVEPSIEVFCDVHFDPFRYMKENKKKYGFVLSLYEYVETIPTLWDSVKSFMRAHPEHIAADNSMKFLSDDGGDTYNHCHFWSNFEIGNLDWLRSPAYMDYFNALDHDGGFFYERWGDAPVHSIAAGLMLNRDELHFFNEIAYYHVPFTHCPTGDDLRLKLKCHCNPKDNFDWKGYSCTSRFFEMNNMKKPEGYQNEQ